VAARKRRPVLYEVYRPRARNADPARRPPPSNPPQPPNRPPPVSDRESEVPVRVPVSHRPATPPAAGRWQVTISGPTLAILSAGTVVLLAVVFSAGRHYESLHPGAARGAGLEQPGEVDLSTAVHDGAGADTDAAEASRVGQPSPAEDNSGGAATTSDLTDDQARQIVLRPGYHYVVIQHFRKTSERQAARKAAEYLQGSGVACATMTGADIRLIATEPFLIKQRDAAAARRERERADRLMRRIKDLGQQYNKELLNQGERGYTFSDCYLFEIR
jgi:hypothetical protein